jgi:uncharacterized membrane protein
MDKETMDMVMGIVFICVGLLVAMFHRFVAMKAIYYQGELRSLSLGKKEADPTEIKVTTFAFLIAGLLFASVGALTLFKVIRFK